MKFHQLKYLSITAITLGLASYSLGCQSPQETPSQLESTRTQLHIQQTSAEKEDLTLNRNNIKNKVHIKKMKQLKEDQVAVDKYFDQLSTKDLLESAAEMSEEAPLALDDNGPVLIPHLKKRWSNGIPHQQLDKQMKDKTLNKKYRMFLIDLEASLFPQGDNDEVIAPPNKQGS